MASRKKICEEGNFGKSRKGLEGSPTKTERIQVGENNSRKKTLQVLSHRKMVGSVDENLLADNKPLLEGKIDILQRQKEELEESYSKEREKHKDDIKILRQRVTSLESETAEAQKNCIQIEG